MSFNSFEPRFPQLKNGSKFLSSQIKQSIWKSRVFRTTLNSLSKHDKRRQFSFCYAPHIPEKLNCRGKKLISTGLKRTVAMPFKSFSTFKNLKLHRSSIKKEDPLWLKGSHPYGRRGSEETREQSRVEGRVWTKLSHGLDAHPKSLKYQGGLKMVLNFWDPKRSNLKCLWHSSDFFRNCVASALFPVPLLLLLS